MAPLELSNKQQMAFNCGCRGQRGVRTWLKKIQRLEKLGFIKTKTGPDGPQSFAIIFDPYQVIEKIILDKKLSEEMVTAFYARIIAVGADDLSTAKKKKRAEMAVDDLFENKTAKSKPPGQKPKG